MHTYSHTYILNTQAHIHKHTYTYINKYRHIYIVRPLGKSGASWDLSKSLGKARYLCMHAFKYVCIYVFMCVFVSVYMSQIHYNRGGQSGTP